MHGRDSLMPEAARAFLRHAYGKFYSDFSNVDLKQTKFHWKYTFRNALLSFKDAVLRRGRQMQLLHTHRRYTRLQGEVPEEERERFAALIKVYPGGGFSLTTEFERAVQRAIDDADTYAQGRRQ